MVGIGAFFVCIRVAKLSSQEATRNCADNPSFLTCHPGRRQPIRDLLKQSPPRSPLSAIASAGLTRVSWSAQHELRIWKRCHAHLVVRGPLGHR